MYSSGKASPANSTPRPFRVALWAPSHPTRNCARTVSWPAGPTSSARTPSGSWLNDVSVTPLSMEVPMRPRCSVRIRSVSYWGSEMNSKGTDGGSSSMTSDVCSPLTKTFWPRIGVLASSASPSTPVASQISRVRGWIPTAFVTPAGASSRSMIRHPRPRRRSSLAAVNPTGPPPTTSTSTSVIVSPPVASSIPCLIDASTLSSRHRSAFGLGLAGLSRTSRASSTVAADAYVPVSAGRLRVHLR